MDVKHIVNPDNSLWVVPNNPNDMKIYYQQQIGTSFYDMAAELLYAIHMLYDWVSLIASGATPTANQLATVNDIKANYLPLLSLTLENAMKDTEWKYSKALKPSTAVMNNLQSEYLSHKIKAYGSI
jgi:hypothetical protein